MRRRTAVDGGGLRVADLAGQFLDLGRRVGERPPFVEAQHRLRIADREAVLLAREVHDQPRGIHLLDRAARVRAHLDDEHVADRELRDDAHEGGGDAHGVGAGELGQVPDPHQNLDLGLAAAGIKLIGPGDIVQDSELANMGDTPIGIITMHHYSAAATRPENKKFVAAWHKAYGADSVPDFMAVQGYDGMAAIYHIIARDGAKISGTSAMKALEGWKFESPQGPIMIDPKTRDIVDNQYLRKTEKVNGKLENVEFQTIPMVKDPWKELQGKK